MADRRAPTLRRRRLAAELRRLRTIAELTLQQAANRLGDGWSYSKLSRIETARFGVSPADLARLLDIYGVSQAKREKLIKLGHGARARGWWDAYSGSMPSGYASYIELESQACALRCFDAMTVHGLMQTEDYARVVITAALMALSPPAETERRVEVTMTRQRVLARAGNPLEISAVLHEAALRAVAGSPQIMRAQHEHLLKLAELPHVELRVLPQGAAAHPAAAGAFSIMEFPEPHDPAVVYLETMTSNLFIESDAEVYRYSLAFDRLRGMALGPEESKLFIAALAGRASSGHFVTDEEVRS